MNEHPAIEYVRNLQCRVQDVDRSTNHVREDMDALICVTKMLGVLAECILLDTEVQLLLSQEDSLR